MKILIIEDEKSLADGLKKGLQYHNFCVDVAYSGEDGYLLTQQFEYDIILLDLILPDIKGEEICKKLRREKNNTYILMLTAKKETGDIVDGLNCGADDYLTKPFKFSELLARIRALIRRTSKNKENILHSFDIKLYLDSERVEAGPEEVRLTKKEFMILEYLLREKGSVLDRNQILEHVWDRNVNIFTNVVDTHIKNLRRKLGRSGSIVETVFGSGYRIKDDNE
ncbi:MAG: response regulator transcription factor [Actinomycetia bacterium]|nr:response regulator transcription factor [Actinomycetes bacterium]